ncbi:hypothetical protein [Nonomuraea sp. NPDC049504]|uniref:hypothetical protein n=1 Tax=Nonomuraea sp. NPDC049504 TaxID=3154729 RepID=UPI003412D190
MLIDHDEARQTLVGQQPGSISDRSVQSDGGKIGSQKAGTHAQASFDIDDMTSPTRLPGTPAINLPMITGPWAPPVPNRPTPGRAIAVPARGRAGL